MSDDIVIQLRKIVPIHEGRKGHDCIAEAADEIELLRNLVETYQKESKMYQASYVLAKKWNENYLLEINRLRERIAKNAL